MTTRPQLIDQMPYDLRRQDGTGDYQSWMDVLQHGLDIAYTILDRYKEVHNVDEVDVEAVVNAMLDGLGNPFDVGGMSFTQKRLLVRALLNMFRKFGTDDTIREVVATFTDKVVTNIIRGQFLGWRLGFHQLGDGVNPVDSRIPNNFIVLYPSRLFQIYSFMIELDSTPTQDEIDKIKEVIHVAKPAYLHYIGVAGITAPPYIDHWQLGDSDLGLTSDLHGI